MIVPRLPAPPVDGGAIYVYQTIKHLAAAGHRVIVAGFESNRHPQDIADLSRFAKVHAIDADFREYTVWPLLKSVFTGVPVSIQNRMDRSKMARLLPQIQENIDAVYLEAIHVGRFLSLVRERFPDAPVILRQVNAEHNLLYRIADSTRNPFAKFFYWIQGWHMRRFERRVLRAVDAVTSISADDIPHFQGLAPNQRFAVASPGIEPTPRCGIPRENNRILMLSTWSWKPNRDGLTWFMNSVWPSLSQQHPNCRLIIAGGGMDTGLRASLEAERVEVLGFVEDAETLRQSGSLLVAPLFTGSGIKIKVLEAFASGLPVVTTRIGAEGLPVTPGIHYMLAGTPEEFVDSIKRLLQDPELRTAIASQAERFAETWSWESKIADLVSFTEEIVRVSRRNRV
jgi:glycosyltransferase involved in cell wall biosynthesis